MEKLLKVLKDAGVEVDDKLEGKIKNAYPDNNTDDLFTQNEVDSVVKKRINREQKVYEQQIKDLEDKLSGMIDPNKAEEYKKEIDNLKSERDNIRRSLKTDYELKLASKSVGVKDEEYFDFLVDKKGLKDRLKYDVQKDRVVATDKDGNILTENGKKLGPEVLIKELKEEKPEVFGETQKEISSATNPKHKDMDKGARTKEVAEEFGYKTKSEKE
jgi:hypothetical protein